MHVPHIYHMHVSCMLIYESDEFHNSIFLLTVSLNENILKSTTTSIPLEEQAPLSASDISRGRRIEAFPDFVSKLRTVKSFGELEKELLNRACDLYTKARFKDGVSMLLLLSLLLLRVVVVVLLLLLLLLLFTLCTRSPNFTLCVAVQSNGKSDS